MDRYALDGHKLYWHLDRLTEWQKQGTISPIYVEISPVSFCNHHCVFCGLDFARDTPHQLDTSTICTRLGEMASLGVKSIMLAGEGEPLLHPGLAEMAKTAKTAGMDVSITTNGAASTLEKWEELLPSLSWLRFSMDAATPERYSLVHGVPPLTLEGTLASLDAALAAKSAANLPVTIGVQFLLIQENLDEVEEAVKLYSRLGVDYLSFKPYSEHPQMRHKSGFTYTDAIISRIEGIIQRYRGKTATELIFRKTATSRYADGVNSFTCCRALPFWGYISAEGDFHTCSVFLNDERFKVGNIYRETMEAVFFGKKRLDSIRFGEKGLTVGHECRLNCRMARINEFLEFLETKPEHVNFI